LSSFTVGGFYAVTVETLLFGAGNFFSTACTQFSTHAWIFHCRPVLAVLVLLLARRFAKGGADNGQRTDVHAATETFCFHSV
jgi:hypothetical protein